MIEGIRRFVTKSKLGQGTALALALVAAKETFAPTMVLAQGPRSATERFLPNNPDVNGSNSDTRIKGSFQWNGQNGGWQSTVEERRGTGVVDKTTTWDDNTVRDYRGRPVTQYDEEGNLIRPSDGPPAEGAQEEFSRQEARDAKSYYGPDIRCQGRGKDRTCYKVTQMPDGRVVLSPYDRDDAGRTKGGVMVVKPNSPGGYVP